MVVSLHVVVGNWIFRTSARSGQPCWLSLCSLRPKDLFIIICKYTVAVFRRTRRGHQISLRVVVSHHVVAGIWTSDLRKSSRVLLPTEPSHQPYCYVLTFSSVKMIHVAGHSDACLSHYLEKLRQRYCLEFIDCLSYPASLRSGWATKTLSFF